MNVEAAIARRASSPRLLRRNDKSITPTEEIRLIARPARHGARHHLRRREHSLDLRAIEPAVSEDFLGKPRDLRPVIFNKPFRLLLDLGPISALGRWVRSYRIKNAIDGRIIAGAHCVVDLLGRAVTMLRRLAYGETDQLPAPHARCLLISRGSNAQYPRFEWGSF
jgi:hypothetical protein